MADAAYDAVVIGGGTKTLFTAMYLAKYGGMEVAILEDRHELGGGLGSHEAPSPGFIGDTHASSLRPTHYIPINEDFPDFEEKGARFTHYPCGRAIILREDHSCFAVYHSDVDPSGERTFKELARFAGEKDAETFTKIYRRARGPGGLSEAVMHESLNLPPLPGEPTATEKWLDGYLAEPDCPIDHRWLKLMAYQAAHELFQHKGLIYMLLRIMMADGLFPDLADGMRLLIRMTSSFDMSYAVGGTHSVAHACYRIFLENGGRFFTKSEVDRVIIENGKAQGVRLMDGAEVAARRVVVSGVDPHQLCFRLIGREHLSERILRKVENLERSLFTPTWYTWAIHELPRYRAAEYNPDINNAHWVILGNKEPEYLLQEGLWRRLGKKPPGDAIAIFGQHSQYDETRAPEGKHVASSEEVALAGHCLTEREWMEFKKAHAEKTISVWQEYAPNMTWDNVIGYDPITPWDQAKRQKNMAPAGCNSIIDRIPGQMFPFTPIPEMADHRTPIERLYATGSAWGPRGGGTACQGYTCYKAIAQDLGLGKPWEEKGRPY